MKKVILITGANKGIGFEIARQCGKLGFHVIISGRDETRLLKALGDLRDEGLDVDSLLMDVSDRDSVRNAAFQSGAKGLRLDVLVNNAGISLRRDKSILTNDEGIIDNIIATNSYGPLYVTKEFLPMMNKPGRVIMISSSGGILNGPVQRWSPAYCVSKTLLNAFTKQLAAELESLNIAVNAVCPGWVKTDMGGYGASRSLEKGAETPVWLATEAPQSLTGRFIKDKKELTW